MLDMNAATTISLYLFMVLCHSDARIDKTIVEIDYIEEIRGVFITTCTYV